MLQYYTSLPLLFDRRTLFITIKPTTFVDYNFLSGAQPQQRVFMKVFVTTQHGDEVG